MQKEINIFLSPEKAANEELYKLEIAKALKIKKTDITHIDIQKRSIDARQSPIKILMTAKIWYGGEMPEINNFEPKLQDVTTKPEVVIVGAGPAGLFAALKLIENGLKPIIIERGKEVSLRKRDVAQINRNQPINIESNYCFGEGGAGTFSDGKLYTRSKKRGDTIFILDMLKFHGANPNIMSDAHPHIGTEILPRIIVNIRKSITSCGGQFLFETKVTDLIIKNNEVIGVRTSKNDIISGKAVILATGHSARDIYEMLFKNNILLEEKSFAMGVRVEHQQSLIDMNQYRTPKRDFYLPASSYSLVAQSFNRGVYSFCMCPGGFIVPASTGESEVVVNGMSPSKRNSVFANSGVVVEIRAEDFPERKKYGIMAGLKFQQHFEELAYKNGGGGLISPAQTINDFVSNKTSTTLPVTSYHPGVVSTNFNDWMPDFIKKRLLQGFYLFDKKIKGFASQESIMLGVESRTSSPVRIPRNSETLQHVQIKNLYPCGEGAGYAGGIVSAAIDGVRCAEKISL